jgi:hypothetical protein
MEVLIDFIWKKYTNPCSVWVRFFIITLLILSIWSRIWIDEWSLVFIFTTCLWIFFNPRIFPVKFSNSIWTMQAILGERIWLNRKNGLIPANHYFIISGLQYIVMLSFLLSILGTILLSIKLTVFGLILTFVGMGWFLDRMVWLYNDDKRQREIIKNDLLKRKRKKNIRMVQKQLEKVRM